MKIKEEIKLEIIDIFSEINLDSLLNKIVAKICLFLDCEESSIFLYNSITDELYFETATGENQAVLKQITLKKNEGIAGWIASHLKSVIINDCAKDHRFSSKADCKTLFKTKSLLGTPVTIDNSLIGIVEALNKKNGTFSADDLSTLEYLAALLAIPLQNAILFKKISKETKEKDQLIKLGKLISSSFGFEEVFATLKEILLPILFPSKLEVIVISQNKAYDLLNNTSRKISKQINSFQISIKNNHAVFPLFTEKKALGFLEVKYSEKISAELINLIQGLAFFVAISLEKYELYSQKLEQEKIQKELQIARDIQLSFLPKAIIPLNQFQYSFAHIPSSAVGGDYCDIIPLSDQQTIFNISDIAGHGIPASLLMSIFRTNFIYFIKQNQDIQSTLIHLNNLIAETTDVNHYVTSFTCKIHSKTKVMEYINAGHHAPLIIRNNSLIKVEDNSMVIGMFAGDQYQISKIQLQSADLIFLFTDGLIEAENPFNQPFSKERLAEFLFSCQSHSPQHIKELLLKELYSYVDQNVFTDDITFIIIKIL
jgi:sigma-B regulation protein RsbU (phosphoserine phosphatase)